MSVRSPHVRAFQFLTRFRISISIILHGSPNAIKHTFRYLFSHRSKGRIRISIFKSVRGYLLCGRHEVGYGGRVTNRAGYFQIREGGPRVRAFLSIRVWHVRRVVFMVVQSSDERQASGSLWGREGVVLRGVSFPRGLVRGLLSAVAQRCLVRA